MNKRKIGLIVVVLFLLIGLGSFVFANPNEEENLKKKGKDTEETETIKDKDSVEDEPTEESDDDSNTIRTINSNGASSNNNGNTNNDGSENNGGTGGTAEADNGYSQALKAVEKAESSFTQEDADKAEELVNKVIDPKRKEELKDRLDAVQNAIDAEKLVSELENKVKSSKNITGINDARDYHAETEIEKIVSELKDSTLKDELEERLEAIGKILNDNDGPIITGIDNNSFTKKDVKLTIEDANDVTTTVTLDGKEIEYTGTFTEEGTYVITVVDKAFNESTLTFTIDKTKPTIGGVEDDKYYNTDVAVTINDTNASTVHLKKDGTLVKPYKPGDKVTEEGTYTVYVADKAGNKSDTITFVIDKTNPEILDIIQEYENKENGRIKVTIKTSEEVFGDNFHNYAWRKTDENTYVNYYYETKEVTISATDKAGNPLNYTFTVDKTAPVVKTLGITNIDNYKDEVGKLYAKNGDKLRVLIYFEEKLAVEPTVKLGGKEFTATYRESSSKPESNSYAYYADVKITDEMNLSDGIIAFEVYGYKDSIGNTGIILTQENVNNKTYPSVTIDNTVPELNFNNGFITAGYTVEVNDDNFSHMVVTYYDGREKETIESNTFALDKEGDNTRYNIVAYDKAGNVSSYRDIYLDNVSPVVSGKAINGGEEVSLENNGTYQKVTLSVSDGSLKNVSLVKEDGTLEDLKTFQNNYTNKKLTYEKEFTDEGVYVIKSVDRNNNESTITFTIDKTPAKRVYSTLDFDKTSKLSYEVDGNKAYYVTNGNSFVFRMEFSEELKTNPTVTVGGMDVPMALNEKYLNNEGKYIYEGTVSINKEAELEEGKLEIVLSNIVDLAGNVSSDEAVLNQTPTSNGRVAIYDKTAPTVTKVQIINNSNPNSSYIKNGETIRVRATFDEELAVAPILTIGKYTATFKNVGDGKGNDLYSADIVIDDEMELEEGNIKFTITSYQDKAGNTGKEVTEDIVKSNITYDRTLPTAVITYSTTELTNGNILATLTASEDIKLVDNTTWDIKEGYAKVYKKAYPMNSDETITLEDKAGNRGSVKLVITNIDKKAPTFNFDNGNIFSSKEIVVSDDNFDYMVLYNYNTKEEIKVTTNTYMMDSGNTMYKVTAYDKAGNISEIWIYHDDLLPTFNGTGTQGANTVEFKDGEKYQSLDLNVVDTNLEEVKLINTDTKEESKLCSFSYDDDKTCQLSFTDAGNYQLVAIDRANNESKVNFTIGKAKTEIKLSAPESLVYDTKAKNYIAALYDEYGNKVAIDLDIVYDDETGRISEAVNAGKYVAISYFGGNDIYEKSYVRENFEITRATPTIELIAPESLVYDGSAKEYQVKVYGADGKEIEQPNMVIIYRNSTDEIYNTNNSDKGSLPVDAGKYSLGVYVRENDNYTRADKWINFEILSDLTVDGVGYNSLKEAIANSNGQPIILNNDITSNVINISQGQNVTIDLNGHNINFNTNQRFNVSSGTLTLIGKGTIKEINPYYAPVLIGRSATDTTLEPIEVNIGKDVTLEGWAGIFIDKNSTNTVANTTVNLEGSINSVLDTTGIAGHGIYINGLVTNLTNYPVINIKSTANIKSLGDGIYAAGYAEWNIDGAYIEAPSMAIGIKSGKLNISGGTFVATGERGIPTPVGNNGIAGSGAALQIESNSGYASNMEINITGGTFESKQSASVYEYSDSETTQVNKINISGGAFISGSNDSNLVMSDYFYNKFLGFVTGGTYNRDITKYVADGYKLENQDANYVVIKNN